MEFLLEYWGRKPMTDALGLLSCGGQGCEWTNGEAGLAFQRGPRLLNKSRP